MLCSAKFQLVESHRKTMTRLAIIGEFLAEAQRFPAKLYLKTNLIGCCHMIR